MATTSFATVAASVSSTTGLTTTTTTLDDGLGVILIINCDWITPVNGSKDPTELIEVCLYS
jgi:hypothetical protein